MTDDELKKVSLHDFHVQAGARMVPFAGYSMPVKYTKIKDEHLAVREGAGLFDVSHMGQVEVRGPGAIEAVNRLITNDMKRLVDGKALYTMMCNEDGGIVDDLVIYRLAKDHILLCVNAANRHRDLSHIETCLRGDAAVGDISDNTVQLALQGPKAESILAELTDVDLGSVKFFRSVSGKVAGVETLIARTGYTGEDGFELYLPVEGGDAVFGALLDYQDRGLTLCGLGCRDTLRLEAGLMLHGQDIDENTNPLEAGLGWVVKFDLKGDFVGREALERIKKKGVQRRFRGMVLEGRGVLRPGYPIELDGAPIGELTSGSYSPTLEASIGLGYIDKGYEEVENVEIQIRGRSVAARIVDPPFYKRSR